MTQKDATEILIVEDSPTQAEQLNHILESGGYLTSVAANGKEALDMLGSRRPALVVSDIVMPEMDGFELCRRIKADERFKGVPVILLTALSEPEDVLRGLESGADSFITKPYDESYLLARMSHVLINAEQRRSAADGSGAGIFFRGKKYLITSERLQVLDLLLSTYETAVMKNSELKEARDELEAMNEQLQAEIRERRRREEEVRRLNEDLLCHAMRLEEANRDLESFGYSISHDLKAPLRAISGFSRIIEEDYTAGLEGEPLRLLKAIAKNADRMGRLIDDLLAFSMIGNRGIELKVIDIGKMVRQVIDELMPSLGGRSVRFELKDLPPALGDLTAVRQVFLNLIENAVKFSGRRNGAVVEIGAAASGNEISYYVKDNGVGFNPDYAGKLFGVFQRLHSNSEFEGTGIGLAIVKRIVNKLGGRVWAEGKQGEGATFYFTLRAAGAEGSPSSQCGKARRELYGGDRQNRE